MVGQSLPGRDIRLATLVPECRARLVLLDQSLEIIILPHLVFLLRSAHGREGRMKNESGVGWRDQEKKRRSSAAAAAAAAAGSPAVVVMEE